MSVLRRVRLPRSGKVRLGIVIALVFLLMGVFGPWWVAHVMHTTTAAVDFNHIGTGPDGAHLLGTNTSGQDVLAQLLAGAQGSVYVGLLSGLIATGCAALVGVTAGFVGGITDRILNSFTNLVMTLPGFALLIIVSGYTTNAGIVLISVIIGLLEWPYGARFLRAQAMSMRKRDFTAALETVGESRFRIITAEVLPHLAGIISAMFLRAVVAGVFAQAALAFLGIDAGAAVSWGTMIGDAQTQNAILRGLWWWWAPPGLCIALLGTATALINFGLDEKSNPALRTANHKVVQRFNRAQARARRAAAAVSGAGRAA
jgi:peptide/nickel transport system permease protein